MVLIICHRIYYSLSNHNHYIIFSWHPVCDANQASHTLYSNQLFYSSPWHDISHDRSEGDLYNMGIRCDNGKMEIKMKSTSDKSFYPNLWWGSLTLFPKAYFFLRLPPEGVLALNSRDEVRSKFGREHDKREKDLLIKNWRSQFRHPNFFRGSLKINGAT